MATTNAYCGRSVVNPFLETGSTTAGLEASCAFTLAHCAGAKREPSAPGLSSTPSVTVSWASTRNSPELAFGSVA